jgi:hypothetical protein
MSEIILCPAGNKDGQDIPIDMGHWAQLEARVIEIATVTPTKAPELLATFNRAALDLDKLGNMLELEYQLAVREAEKVRAEVLLDRVPKILQEKGLATAKSPMGSEDLRNAILAQDKDYEAAQDRADQLKAMMKMIRGKYDFFERAFRSVRTLVGEQNFNFTLPARELSAGERDQRREVGINRPPPAGFGTPKY